jgi:hypothetical protein
LFDLLSPIGWVAVASRIGHAKGVLYPGNSLNAFTIHDLAGFVLILRMLLAFSSEIVSRRELLKTE